MASRPDYTPVIAIVGETASGKTALALQLAHLFPGEIIAADSRTAYKGMDIGTAKPTFAERATVRHHCIDVVTPAEHFTAADFKRLATAAIKNIGQSGKIAYVVGGTGLYVDSLLYDFQFRAKGDPVRRKILEACTVPELQQIATSKGIPLPENKQNPRHLIRAIETNGAPSTRGALRPHTLIIGLRVDREVLYQKLTARVDQMIADGFLEEVRVLSEQYGWEVPALQAPGYRAFRGFFARDISLSEAKAQFVHNDMLLAKRQRTWFKRNTDINWICNQEEAVELVTTFLNK